METQDFQIEYDGDILVVDENGMEAKQSRVCGVDKKTPSRHEWIPGPHELETFDGLLRPFGMSNFS